ncbi:MAG: ATP-binding protein [Clostridia bacterium]|nr:ATP-binding protein [Clostridia bacterium]MBQ8771802.1 ATP-binding protein [Clostridia bacterium]MBQ8873215.1 ATP-binding protein [Clostridia bacterium]MBR7177393.1 ATP-binding protein [Clostridia bacterium]
MSSLHLEYEVEGNNFVSAGQATEKVKFCLKGMGINPADIRRIAIAMYEAEINMVIHANGGKALVDIFVDKIVVKLVDTGPGIADIDKAMTPGFSTATDSIRDLGFGAGMGLPNMKKYTDEMYVESTVGVGTTITLVVNFS